MNTHEVAGNLILIGRETSSTDSRVPGADGVVHEELSHLSMVRSAIRVTHNVGDVVPAVVIRPERVLGDDDRTDILDERRSDGGVSRSTRKPNHPRLVRGGISQRAVGFFEPPEERGVVGAPNSFGRYAARPVTRQGPGHILQRVRDLKVCEVNDETDATDEGEDEQFCHSGL